VTAPHLLDRRQFLRGSLALGGGVVAASLPGGIWARTAHAGEDAVRVYVIVVDGLRPDQLPLMPTVAQLAAEGTHWPEARAQMVAETTPNHISMLTGMRVDRHGMPGNAVPGLAGRVSDDRRYLKADTVFTLAARQGPELVTAAATSKDYIVETSKADRTGDGEEDATATNDPALSIPGSDAAPDTEVGADALRLSRELDPDFLFVNLGDVDRAGHVDASGGLFAGTPVDGTQPAFQAAALTNADLQIRLLIEELRDSGRWERTVFLVTADHSMDWSFADRQLDLAGAFDADDLLAGEVVTAVNGGACLYALRAPDEPQAAERLRRMRTIALGTEGIDDALYVRPNPVDGGEAHTVGTRHPDWGLTGDLSGDLIVTVEPGYRIGHGGPADNPIPGNHGHTVTLRIPMLVGGGWDGIARDQLVAPDGPVGPTDRPVNQAENIDIAPTVAWLLGLGPPPGGFDGRVLAEAFTRRPAPRVAIRNVHSLPVFEHLGADSAVAASVALSRSAFPDGLDGEAALGPIPLTTGDEQVDDVVLGGLGADRGEATVLLGPAAQADRLAGAGPLGAGLGAPLLLSHRDGLPSAVADELDRLAPSRIVLLGGEDVLSSAVADAAGDTGADVVRFDGDAAEIAAAAARELGVADGQREVLLVDDVPAAAAGQVAAIRRARPVLLTRDGEVPPPTQEAVDDLGIDRVVLAGDTTAIGTATEQALRDGDRLVERIAPAGGQDTSRRLTERGVREGALTDDLHLAADPAVALAAAPAVARLGGSLLLLPAGGVPSFVVDRADEFVRVRFLGPVPASTVDEVTDAIVTRRTRAVEDEEPATVPPPAPGAGGTPPSGSRRPDGAGGPPPAGGPPAGTVAASGPLPVTGTRVSTAAGLGALALAAALRIRGRTTAPDAD
jgi:putative cell wall-binding protein/arylsulfatase A-like enzyme